MTAKKKNSGRVTWGRRTRRLDKNEVYLSVTQAATKYGFHPKTIRKWIHCGALSVTYVGPHRTIRIRDSDMIDMQTPTRGDE